MKIIAQQLRKAKIRAVLPLVRMNANIGIYKGSSNGPIAPMMSKANPMETVEVARQREAGTYVTYAAESSAVMIKPWQRNRASVPPSR